MTVEMAVAPLAVAMTVKLCVPTPSWLALKATGRLPKKKKTNQKTLRFSNYIPNKAELH